MNIQQLEYIVHVHEEKHFARAAERSFVTQPTLSMMIQKLEDELGVKIFDRSKQPVATTKEGLVIIEMAKRVVYEFKGIKSFTNELTKDFTGDVYVGVIPTLAPYLLPLILKNMSKEFPTVRWHFKELFTSEILIRLKTGTLDFGLLAGPLNDDLIEESELFQEAFYAYFSNQSSHHAKKKFSADDLKISDQIWLLEEGHCMRHQMMHLCQLQKKQDSFLQYEAGSIQSLVNLVDELGGVTIIPELSIAHLSEIQKKQVKPFVQPIPVRSVALATHVYYPRLKLKNKLAQVLQNSMLNYQNSEQSEIVSIQ
jgi:LysR family hydrogen peroxide-inducible transcriptional activator